MRLKAAWTDVSAMLIVLLWYTTAGRAVVEEPTSFPAAFCLLHSQRQS